jgi:hypothetical protein
MKKSPKMNAKALWSQKYRAFYVEKSGPTFFGLLLKFSKNWRKKSIAQEAKIRPIRSPRPHLAGDEI